MTSGESPAVARRRLRLALRRAREAAGLTQAEVAEEMEWSVSKVMRIESGDVTISTNDLKLLLPLIKITDKAEAADLLQAARTSRMRREWWDEPRFKEHLTSAMRQVIQFESEARVTRYFCPHFVAGNLQTEAYARAIFDGFPDQLSAETIHARVDARLTRGQRLQTLSNPPEILLLLDQSVLLRQIGGPEALAEQLEALLQLAAHETFYIRILPFTEVRAVPTIGAFEVHYLTDEGIDGAGDAVLYRESGYIDEIVDAKGDIARHRDLFESLWAGAVNEEDSTSMISAAIRSLSATQTSG